MALPEREYRAQTYHSAYPQRERPVPEYRPTLVPQKRKVEIAEAAPQKTPETFLTGEVLAKSIVMLIFAGILLVGTIFLTAKATEIKYASNSLSRQNVTLQKEIDLLQVKIGSANSIESIEAYATEELGMRYPKSGQCIYLKCNQASDVSLAKQIRQKAYQE